MMRKVNKITPPTQSPICMDEEQEELGQLMFSDQSIPSFYANPKIKGNEGNDIQAFPLTTEHSAVDLLRVDGDLNPFDKITPSPPKTLDHQ